MNTIILRSRTISKDNFKIVSYEERSRHMAEPQRTYVTQEFLEKMKDCLLYTSRCV